MQSSSLNPLRRLWGTGSAVMPTACGCRCGGSPTRLTRACGSKDCPRGAARRTGRAARGRGRPRRAERRVRARDARRRGRARASDASRTDWGRARPPGGARRGTRFDARAEPDVTLRTIGRHDQLVRRGRMRHQRQQEHEGLPVHPGRIAIRERHVADHGIWKCGNVGMWKSSPAISPYQISKSPDFQISKLLAAVRNQQELWQRLPGNDLAQFDLEGRRRSMMQVRAGFAGPATGSRRPREPVDVAVRRMALTNGGSSTY